MGDLFICGLLYEGWESEADLNDLGGLYAIWSYVIRLGLNKRREGPGSKRDMAVHAF